MREINKLHPGEHTLYNCSNRIATQKPQDHTTTLGFNEIVEDTELFLVSSSSCPCPTDVYSLTKHFHKRQEIKSWNDLNLCKWQLYPR